MSERLLMSVKDMPDGRWMAVISQGGHPVIAPDMPCVVLDVNVFATQQECEDWFAQAQIERPWETRQ